MLAHSNSLLDPAHSHTEVSLTDFKAWQMPWPSPVVAVPLPQDAQHPDTWLLTGRVGGSLVKGKLSKEGKQWRMI